MTTYIIILGILLIVLLTGIVIIICVEKLHNQQGLEDEEYEEYEDYEGREPAPCRWQVEFWNVSQGIKFLVTFGQQVFLGRGLPGETYSQIISVVPEETISLFPEQKEVIRQIIGVAAEETIAREQCAIFTYNGQLFIENLATVNRTVRNGVQLKVPECLQIGDRITMGISTFLVTNIEYG